MRILERVKDKPSGEIDKQINGVRRKKRRKRNNERKRKKTFSVSSLPRSFLLCAGGGLCVLGWSIPQTSARLQRANFIQPSTRQLSLLSTFCPALMALETASAKEGVHTINKFYIRINSCLFLPTFFEEDLQHSLLNENSSSPFLPTFLRQE